MKNRNRLSAQVADILSRMRRDYSERSRLLGYLDRMELLLGWSYICGSWIDDTGNRSLLVSMDEDGISLMLCDDSHCYKTILLDTRMRLQGRRMIIVGSDGTGQGEISLDKEGRLHCGDLGTFYREEKLLREEHVREMDRLSQQFEHQM